jgi:DNA-binding IclR family transcriptional regulator
MKPATTITKVCRVLGEFRNRPAIGVSELARRTKLLPSDVHRILCSLETYGYIEQDLQTKRYHLGGTLLRLGLATLQVTELREAGRPILKTLSEQIGATTHMAMFDTRELEVFLVEQIDAPGEVLLKPRFGVGEPFHATALGKTIMASVGEAAAARMVEKTGLTKRTKNTIADPKKLEVELATIRRLGYGVDREESNEGACCIGAPVRDMNECIVASVSASMPADIFYRWHEPELAALIKAAAGRLSAAIGYGANYPSPIRASRH